MGWRNCCQYERRAWHEGGRGTSNIDMLPIGDKRMPVKLGQVAQPELDETLYYPSHTGIDFYHRYKDDIALLARNGFEGIPNINFMESLVSKW